MTVLEYVDIFEDLFLIGVAYLKKGSKVLLRREKKIFFRDLFIYKTFSIWTGEEVKKDALLEFIVQEHLYRKFGEIYYYRNSYEIDAIAGDLKVEVKTTGTHRRYPKKVIVLT